MHYYLLRIGSNNHVDIKVYEDSKELKNDCSKMFEYDFLSIQELDDYLGNDLGDFFELFYHKIDLIEFIINYDFIDDETKIQTLKELFN